MRKILTVVSFFYSITFAQSYWQQDVHYKIDAELNTHNHTIVGKETLIYKNNSPDVLDVVYFRLYWNLFTKNSYGHKLSLSRKNYYEIPESGVSIKRFFIIENGYEQLPECKIDNTLMEVKLEKPLRPGESITFGCEWEGKVPEGGYRTGHQGRDYDIAQWYPQIATYDKYGWDKSQYLGDAEFHNEFGTFDVNITIPKSFILGYTGVLLNPDEVYHDSILTKLKENEGNTETVRLADFSKTEWGAAESTLVTWKFHAENVRDFAWSANEHYIWDVIHWTPNLYAKPIRIQTLYFKDKSDFWKEAAKFTQHAISFFSNHFGMYAYPNCFVVEGVVGGGMEYPGITFIGHYGDEVSHSLFGVITHEVAHNWYPMMVGTNETAYGFMDEGFVTFMTILATENFYGRYNNVYEWKSWFSKFLCFPNDNEREATQRGSLELQKSGFEEPISTHMYRFEHGQAGASIYSKTGSVLLMLQYVLGDSAFEYAMKEYFKRWQFKHPYPEDFYAVMQEAGGQKDLRWFFDEWFNKTVTCDYGLNKMKYDTISINNEKIYRTKIEVYRNKPAVMPVDVAIEMADGSIKTVWLPIDKWLNAEYQRDTIIDLHSKPLRADLNPDGRILDINRLNNHLPLLKVRLSFDNTLFNVTPIDEYLIKWRPSLWFTDRGGWNIGYKIRGSYLEDLYATSLWQVYNTRDKTLDYDLSFSHNTFALTPLSSGSGRLYHIEGRRGGLISLQKEIRRNYSVPPFHTFRLTYSFSRIDDKNYLWHPEFWDDGNLHRLIFGYSYYNRGSFWNVRASANIEGSSSFLGKSDFQYSKRTFEINTNFKMPGRWDLNVRLYNGIGYGNIPTQTKYYYSSTSPLEQVSEPLVRSKGVIPVRIREHTLSQGGGWMRGYYKYLAYGDKIEALNSEARFNSMIPFMRPDIPVLSYLMHNIQSSLFFDAGRISSQSEDLWNKRFEIDCGFGFRLAPFWNFMGEFANSDLLSSLGLNTIKVDFPIYVSVPAVGENKLKFRWVVSFSVGM